MAKDEIVKFYGVKETIKLMRQVEPETLKALRKDIRRIAQPGVSAIKSGSPTVAPLSGMAQLGRTGYSRPKVTVAITPFKKSYGFGSTTANLVSITAKGSGSQVGFEIADMAGKANRPGSYGSRSRKYIRNGREMRHRLAPQQGRKFIDNLNQDGRASRYVYANLERHLPQIRAEVAISLSKFMNEFNGRLNTGKINK